jgi:hypothetical protein
VGMIPIAAVASKALSLNCAIYPPLSNSNLVQEEADVPRSISNQ